MAEGLPASVACSPGAIMRCAKAQGIFSTASRSRRLLGENGVACDWSRFVRDDETGKSYEVLAPGR